MGRLRAREGSLERSGDLCLDLPVIPNHISTESQNEEEERNARRVSVKVDSEVVAATSSHLIPSHHSKRLSSVSAA